MRMFRMLAIVGALAGTTAACGGNCPARGGGNAASAGGEVPVVASQGPVAHETPEHNLEFDGDHLVEASPSDRPPERLDAGTVQHIVQGQIPDIHQCYENALVAHPQLAGRVVVLMHISRSGNVVSTEIAENTTTNEALAACIEEHIDDWHFPEAEHDIAVRYPFLFRPTASGGGGPGQASAAGG